METQKPLSQYGIGPVYVAVIFILTVAAPYLSHFRVIPVVWHPYAEIPLKILGAAFLVGAAVLWFNAVVTMNITKHIRQNQLVTSGAYGWVRNPIYCAIMFAMWGLLLLSGNLLLLILCPVYHLLMAVMVKHTEEKWLTDRYGKTYLDYCKEVNRCIPWFPGKRGGN